MKYTDKRFTVAQSGERKDPCGHGWLDLWGRCVLCGERPSQLRWSGNTGEFWKALEDGGEVVSSGPNWARIRKPTKP